MIRRLIERLEDISLRPAQGFLAFLAFTLIRMQVEVLFLDPDRGLDFFLVNFLYFFSLLFCFVLVLSGLTRVPIERVFRVAIPFSAVILVPLLDLFFYPHLRGESLLALCRLPLPEGFRDGLTYAASEVLGHRFVANAQVSLGLRLEVLAASAGAALYVFFRASGGWRRWPLAATAYLLFLVLIYAHVMGVIHPATRLWVFTPLIIVECLVVLWVWDRATARSVWRGFAWLETALLLVAVLVGFVVLQVETRPEIPPFSQPLNALFALITFGFGLGQLKARARGATAEATAIAVAAAMLSLLMGYLVVQEFFVTLAMLWGLACLGWSLPWRLADRDGLYAVGAGLALWMTTWAGYTIVYVPTELDKMMLAGAKPPAEDVGREAREGLPEKPPPPSLRRRHVAADAAAISPPTTAPDWFFHPAWLLTPLVVLVGRGLARRVGYAG